MIRNDYLNSGFPINNISPVICFLEDYTLKIAYNSYDLKNIIDSNVVKNCTGVWIGKKNTDIFPLNPNNYNKIAPPLKHKDIDNAIEITVTINSNASFNNISYLLNGLTVLSKDEKLYEYIKFRGFRFKTALEE